MPLMPVNAAGWRIDPPVSVPVAPGHSRAAIAADDPPDDPPGASAALLPAFRHGEITLPNALVSFDDPIANWSIFSLPSIPAPAAHSLPDTVDSYCGLNPLRIALPAVASTPWVQNKSFMPIGTPDIGFSVPAALSASARSAAASACSGVSTRNAFSAFAPATAPTNAVATSRAEKSPSRTPSRMAAMPRSVSAATIL